MALSPEEMVSVTEFIDACCAYRDQAALSPEETVSVTEFLDACLTGTKCSVTRGNGECYRIP